MEREFRKTTQMHKGGFKKPVATKSKKHAMKSAQNRGAEFE